MEIRAEEELFFGVRYFKAFERGLLVLEAVRKTCDTVREEKRSLG